MPSQILPWGDCTNSNTLLMSNTCKKKTITDCCDCYAISTKIPKYRSKNERDWWIPGSGRSPVKTRKLSISFLRIATRLCRTMRPPARFSLPLRSIVFRVYAKNQRISEFSATIGSIFSKLRRTSGRCIRSYRTAIASVNPTYLYHLLDTPSTGTLSASHQKPSCTILYGRLAFFLSNWQHIFYHCNLYLLRRFTRILTCRTHV